MAKRSVAPEIDNALLELIKVSQMFGKDTLLVQGGGGNTSVKTQDGKYMYIKASGTALKDMSPELGWRRMRLDSVLEILTDQVLFKKNAIKREAEVVNRLLSACDDEVSGARPSVDAHLHAILDNCVIHLHSVAVGAFVNAKNGEKLLAKLFAGEKYPPLWIPYVGPGLVLAKKVQALVSGYINEYGRKPAILFLEKHGIFVTASTAQAAMRIVNQTMSTVSSGLKKQATAKQVNPARLDLVAAKLAIRKAISCATGQLMPVSFFSDDVISAFLKQKDAAELLGAGPLTPDELVYSNGAALWLGSVDAAAIEKKIRAIVAKGNKPPVAFIVDGLGLFVVGKTQTAGVIKDIVCGSLLIRMQAAKMGGISALTRREIDFINNWESEALYKQLGSCGSAGQLKDRIAMVTGAGSGLGRSIAVGLARAGAMVALADIDSAGAQETAAMIKAELPGATVMPVKCNVTSEEDVQRGFDSIIDNWGGFDILVNAAGVAPAYALVDLPVDKWRFALEINLTGYFLTARSAARLMIQQGIGGSIVNISSKSGLDASKNNTPYNATKSGELHMARGWALELGQYGIRVNCVAPGNVFEGSKIWNPEYIKTCAKKYGIKPEEVIPYYVNKTALRREIKGQDIADAVVFLNSDNARTVTGQTLVADAGQVMVR